MEFSHRPVMLAETLSALCIRPDGVYIDGTAGGGGHSQGILDHLSSNGRLLMIDQDPDAIETLQERFRGCQNVLIRRGNFSDMVRVAANCGIDAVDGVLLDIGVSSHQLDTPERGFSYHTEAPLDMRMSQEGVSADTLVNTLSVQELAAILERYGEEKHAMRIARSIVAAREVAPIHTTLALAEIVKNAVPAKVRRGEKHPARKTFQALRIAVNGELDALSEGLDAAFSLLCPGGCLAVITFHSLEDRMVKRRMGEWCTGCTCPPDFPVCVCGKKPRAELILKKGQAPSIAEQEANWRARSARLRACRKL